MYLGAGGDGGGGVHAQTCLACLEAPLHSLPGSHGSQSTSCTLLQVKVPRQPPLTHIVPFALQPKSAGPQPDSESRLSSLHTAGAAGAAAAL